MKNGIYEVIGNSIRKIRKAMGMTQEELSSKTGISSSFLSHIERGTKKASIETIYKIANALQVPIEKLFAEIPVPADKYKNDTFVKRIGTLVKDKDEEYKKILLKLAKLLSSKK
ncbi:MAG TPA: helix-turn-helix transcriptional regulator [bacterium]|nr:helix-turn-helix transcriptional regulator [bacterium]HPP09136.1 helix-turn-helix transcriptional regulator [bacterium]